MKEYLDIVREVLNTGTRRENRTGVDTISTFNINYEFNFEEGFPLLTTKKISWKNIVVENLWFLSGARDIGILRKHGCEFWDPWADEQGMVPSAYGNFWRHFPVHSRGAVGFNDQINWVVNELERNPMSRRLVVTAWSPENAQTSALPPCHCLFVFNVQNDGNGEPRLNLHLTQRSCDVALGIPYNIAGYSLILALFSHFTGIELGIFGHTLVDAHIYTAKPDGSMVDYDHVPGLQEQLTRSPRQLPSLELSPDLRSLKDVEALLREDTDTVMSHFKIENYDPHPPIAFKVAV